MYISVNTSVYDLDTSIYSFLSKWIGGGSYRDKFNISVSGCLKECFHTVIFRNFNLNHTVLVLRLIVLGLDHIPLN